MYWANSRIIQIKRHTYYPPDDVASETGVTREKRASWPGQTGTYFNLPGNLRLARGDAIRLRLRDLASLRV